MLCQSFSEICGYNIDYVPETVTNKGSRGLELDMFIADLQMSSLWPVRNCHDKYHWWNWFYWNVKGWCHASWVLWLPRVSKSNIIYENSISRYNRYLNATPHPLLFFWLIYDDLWLLTELPSATFLFDLFIFIIHHDGAILHLNLFTDGKIKKLTHSIQLSHLPS